MSCPFSPEELSAYIDGESGDGIGAKIHQHLQHCARCAQIVASFQLISTTLRQQPHVQMGRSVLWDVCRVVAAQQQRPLRCRKALSMASELLDGELSTGQAARVQAHLSKCDACEREFQLMRTCARLLGEREAVEPPPTLRPRILEAAADAPPGRGRARTVHRLPLWRTAAALSGSLAVAAAVALAVITVPWGSNESDERVRPEAVAQEAPAPANARTVAAIRQPATKPSSAPAAGKPEAAAPKPTGTSTPPAPARAPRHSTVVRASAPSAPGLPLVDDTHSGTAGTEVADLIPANEKSNSIFPAGNGGPSDDTDETTAPPVDPSRWREYASVDDPNPDAI